MKWKTKRKVKKALSGEMDFTEEEGMLVLELWKAMDELEFTPEQTRSLALLVTVKMWEGLNYNEFYHFLAGFQSGFDKILKIE